VASWSSGVGGDRGKVDEQGLRVFWKRLKIMFARIYLALETVHNDYVHSTSKIESDAEHDDLYGFVIPSLNPTSRLEPPTPLFRQDSNLSCVFQHLYEQSPCEIF
jgi:hypothetical protein